MTGIWQMPVIAQIFINFFPKIHPLTFPISQSALQNTAPEPPTVLAKHTPNDGDIA